MTSEHTQQRPSDLLASTVAPNGLVGGRYRIGERIGAGGMATIFRAYDPVLERVVAIKVVHAHLAADDSLIQRFQHEARHAAALDHPNVVHVYDAGVETLPYIVMEYIDGPSLRQVLLQRGRLTPAQALTIMEPVAHALARAHTRGVIHRDVKPENILLSADGRAKVADFGIARTMAATSHTATGQLIGTVHYLAPELVNGQEATSASDQYALGVVLFEVLTGRKALPADSPAAVALRHVRETVPRPGAYISDSNKQLDKVVARATAPDPAKRYRDISAFADALRSAVPGGPVPLAFATDNGSSHTLIVDQGTVSTATMSAARDVAERGAAQVVTRRSVRARPMKRGGSRRSRITTMILMTLGIIALVAITAGAYWNFFLAPVQTVPDVVGMDRNAAESELESLGLQLDIAGASFDLQAPEGEILAQEPAPQTSLRAGNAVAVSVSRGLDTVTVPDLVGATVDEAQVLLSERTLGTVTVEEEVFSDTVERGLILSHDPPLDRTVDQLTDVGVIVSKGIEQIEVPEVTGLTLENAEPVVTDAKLVLEATTEYSDEVPTAGEIISQSVATGSRLDKGSTLAVVVSKGPLTLPLPDVRTKSLKDAVSQLQALDLVVDVDENPLPTIGPFTRGVPGRAEETVPQAGKTVARGDRVLIYTFIGN